MAKPKAQPTHFVVGTQNSNGEDISIFTDEYQARGRLR